MANQINRLTVHSVWILSLFGNLYFSLGSVVSGQDGAAELRVWQDNSGNSVTARFQRYREGIVYLRTNQRKSLQVEPRQLSKPDQDYIVALLKKSKREKDAEEFQRLASARTSNRNFGNSSRTPGGRGGRRSNSGNAASSSTMEPDGFNGGSSDGRKFGGGASSGNRGGRNRGSALTTPAGDRPITVGGDPNRTPSPYARNPEMEQMELDSQPDGNPVRASFDPFGKGRPDFSGPVPSSSEYFASKKKKDSKQESETSIENTRIDPFAEMDPIMTDTQKTKAKNPIENQATSGYQPPVLLNKRDDATSADGQSLVSDAESSGMTTQTMILIAIGIVGFLILIMIALLAMVLMRAKGPKPKRSYM